MSDAIGIDLGGTKILCAVVGEDGTAREHQKVKTPTDGPESIIEAIVELARGAAPSGTPIGVGVPGPVSDGVLLSAPNLVGFEKPVALRSLLSDRLGAAVQLGNDASVGTLGESRHGAARGSGDVLGCWLGTGIGGGLVIGGRLHEGFGGTAGELGHVPVELSDPARCGCGRWGCVEAYAGRASMAVAVQAALDDGEDSDLPAIMADKGKDRMTSGVWKSALKAEDKLATRVMDLAVKALGAALAGAVNVLDPQTIVVGGGLAEKLGQDHVDRIRDEARPRLMAPDADRRWVLAGLGDDAGVVGAAELTR